MSYVEIETGRYVKRWAFWNPATWSIPKLYWDAWSQEQRLHAICRQLEKVIKYADYLGVNVDDIAARLKAIEDGQLNDYIVAAIEAWFAENEPTIMQALQNLNDALPISQFNAENTVSDALTVINGDNWVVENRIANGAVTTPKLADGAVTTPKIADGAITLSKLAPNVLTLAQVLTNSDVNIKIPEQYGAVGDGVTDDTQALQDMLDDLDEYDIVILTKPRYLAKRTLYLNQSFVTITGIDSSEISPTIRFDFNDSQNAMGIYCTGQGNTIANIQLMFDSNYDPVSTNVLLDINGVDNDFNIDYKIYNCILSNTYNCIRIRGRNTKIYDNLFSTWTGNAVIIDQTSSDTALRGFIIKNNRFHQGNAVLDTTGVISFSVIFNLFFTNNFIDGCGNLYRGITDNVTIKDNMIYQHRTGTSYLIQFTRTQSTISNCVITGNVLDDTSSPQVTNGFVSFTANTYGSIDISGNTYFSRQTDYSIITIVENASTRKVIKICDNMLRNMAVNDTPIQVTNSARNVGLCSGNLIMTASTANYISAASLTVDNNFTGH